MGYKNRHFVIVDDISNETLSDHFGEQRPAESACYQQRAAMVMQPLLKFFAWVNFQFEYGEVLKVKTQ